MCRRQEQFEDTKGVTRSRKSKDSQYNAEKKKDKMTNNDIQYTAQKTKDWATRIPQKNSDKLRCPGRKTVPALLVDYR